MNPYGVNHTPLKRARLPVPPLSHIEHRSCSADISIPRGKRFVNSFFVFFYILIKEINKSVFEACVLLVLYIKRELLFDIILKYPSLSKRLQLKGKSL